MYKIIGADQKEYGPISGDQIRQWVSEGRVNSETQICAEGSEEWKPLSAFPELASIQTTAASSEPGVIVTDPAKPSGAVKVFSILNIIFGGLGVVCSPFSFIGVSMSSKQVGYSQFMISWLMFSLVIGMIGSAIMLASGIGLWKMKGWARKLAVYYAIFGCIWPFIAAFMTLTHPISAGPNPELQRTIQTIGAVAGIAIGLTYNGLLIYFLTRPAVKEAFGEKTAGI